MKKTFWRYKFDRDVDTTKILEDVNLSELCKILLLNRNITTKEAAVDFLTNDINSLHDPFLLKDMDKACNRIKQAIENKEKVAVYGDYDVDGVSSTAILISYLKENGVEAYYYIPKRNEEGYGLNSAAIQKLYDKGARLLITVDSGITGINETEYANSIGMDTIITDHHECKEVLPNALAIVNPKQHDCIYPFKELAGVGVVFKIICALMGKENLKLAVNKYSQLVAIGTIADVMPLCGENRIIVQKGLELLNKTKHIGINALIKSVGIENKPLNTTSISFVLAPRINAAGRVGDASSAVELFITEEKEIAEKIAEKLCVENKFRQSTETEIMLQVNEYLHNKNILSESPRILVLSSENWHQGVIGIVASKISEYYFCPAILISIENDIGKGSGRSVGGFNLFRALEGTKDFLLKFGGHELAAGLSIKKDKIEDFEKAINEFSKNELKKIGNKLLEIECKVLKEEVSLETIKEIQKLEPFGSNNPIPLFCLENVIVSDIFTLSEKKHLRLNLLIDNVSYNAFCFNSQQEKLGIVKGDCIDIVFNFNINNYKNKDYVQFIIRELKLSDELEQNINHQILVYDKYKNNLELTQIELENIIPNRDDFIVVYRYLTKYSLNNCCNLVKKLLPRQVSSESSKEINFAKTMICLEVMYENSLIDLSFDNDNIIIKINKNAPKIDLFDSKILNLLRIYKTDK